MPTVSELARVTVKDGSVWRTCARCGQMAAMPPEADRCDPCTKSGSVPSIAVRGRSQ